jgi:hypothetical protein
LLNFRQQLIPKIHEVEEKAMQNLRRVGSAVILTVALALATFAGETNAPPCAPGEVSTPPCAPQSAIEDPTAPGETNTPPASTADLTSVVEFALSMLLF